MFATLGRTAHTRRRWVLGAAVLLTVLAGIFGPPVGDAVRTGGFADPQAESSRVAEVLDDTFGRTEADVVMLWTHESLRPAHPAFGAEIQEVLAQVPTDEVARVEHPWLPGLPDEARAALLSTDGRSALTVLSLSGDTDDERRQAWATVEPTLEPGDGWQTSTAGAVPVLAEMQHLAETDIVRAEVLAMPVLFLLMAVLFGSLVSAALPVTVGALAILGAMALLRALTLVTDVQTFALNVTTILGLGLAIDYALFMVSRFREELGRTLDVATAVERTVATAGRTVAFSGLTVLIAFAGLLFFPHMFLRSMGLGGMAVVLLDMVLALTLLPALLSLLGRRVDAGRLPSGLLGRLTRGRRAQHAVVRGGRVHSRAHGTAGHDARGWSRLARLVLRRPGLLAVSAAAVLAVVALPVLDLQTGQTDARDLPATAETRQALDAIDGAFPGSQDVTLDVVVDGADDPALLTAWAADELATLPAATDARLAGLEGDRAHLVVTTGGTVDAPATRDLVSAVRDLEPPAGATTLAVGGAAAVALDSVDAIGRTLPTTLGFVAGVTVLLLFMALGSVVLPLKAVLMNALSLGATLGVLSWGFGQGHLADLLGFEATGRVDPANLVLIGLIAFGLAMDYELFLLSRVREAHLRGAGTAEAITTGLRRSGRTITSAALLLVVVLVAMGTSEVTFLTLIGLGLAFAVVVDATVVRALLVPATTALLGRAAWWLPRPLARLHRSIGLSEDTERSEHEGPATPPGPDVTDRAPALVPTGR